MKNCLVEGALSNGRLVKVFFYLTTSTRPFSKFAAFKNLPDLVIRCVVLCGWEDWYVHIVVGWSLSKTVISYFYILVFH